MKLQLILGSFAFAIVIFVHYVLCYQTVDLADEGHWLSNSRYVFEDPQAVVYSFSYWLSVVTPAIWGRFFGDTAFSYRILGVFVKISIMLVSVFAFGRYLRLGTLLALVAWGGLLIYGGTMGLYGSSYTAFFYVPTAMLLAIGSIADNRVKRIACFIASGVLMGVGAFARLPNVTDIGFIVVPVFVLLIQKRFTFANVAMTLLLIGLGVAGGGGAMLLLAIKWNHLPLFAQMLSLFAEIGTEGHHSMSILIAVQLRYYWYEFLWTLPFVLAVAGSAILFECFRNHGKSTSVLRRAFGGAIAIIIVLAAMRYPRIGLHQIIPAGLFLLGAVMSVRFERDARWRVMWFSAFVCFALLPLGSDVPSCVNKYCMPFIMPFVWRAFMTTGPIAIALTGVRRISADAIDASLGVIRISMIGMVIIAALMVWKDTLRDYPDRMRLNATTNIPVLAHLHTTQERAAELDRVVAAIRKITAESDRLLVFPGVPGVYACANRRPFVGGTWTRLFTPGQFERQIKAAKLRYKGRLPYVLEEKWNSSWPTWPESKLIYITEQSRYYPLLLKFKGFLKENPYSVIWEDECFRLYQPAK